DTEGDGLSFFANDDGTGQCRLDKVQGIDFENFETDFGKEILKYFYFETTLVNVEEQHAQAASFSLYPNPTSGRTRLRTNGFDSTIDVRIYNASGQLVKQSLVERRNANDDIELNVSDLAQGMHFVRISDDTHVSSLKMVVN
ncbi:MAG: T9SS type A sorting domain-containing protein, partial [Flavobacteriales bacterium]